MSQNPYIPPKSDTANHHCIKKYPTRKIFSVVAFGHIGLFLLFVVLLALIKNADNVFDNLFPILIFIILISSIPTIVIGLFITTKKYTKSTSHLINLFVLIFIVTVLNTLFWSYVSLTLYSGYYPSYLIEMLASIFAISFIFSVVMILILKWVLPTPNFSIKGNLE